jgi:uncharacterized protein (TIGR00251 family)
VAGGWTLAIHVQPGAKRSAIAGLHGDRLKIRVAAPAVEGKANAALVAFLAAALGVPGRCVTVEQGDRSRDKRVSIAAECDPSRLLAETA